MSTIDWTTFKRKVNIKVDKQTVYEAWTIPTQIEQWFLKNAHFYKGGQFIYPKSQIQVGHSYKWKWYKSDHLAEGEVLSMQENESLGFSFLGCEVHVELKYENGVTLLSLTQSKIPTDEASKLNLYVECTRGWTFYMTNLKSILEGGIDLRNLDDEGNQLINT